MKRLTHFHQGQTHRLEAAILLCTSIILLTPRTPLAEPSPWGFENWYLQEFQPPIKPGGRANTIAVHPNDSLILVASESGGLFRSENSGKTWKHVDSLPLFYTNAIAFAKDPKFVIVTASEDFSVSNHGGIWRSENGGKTWTQALWLNPATGNIDLPNPATPPGVTERFSASEISIAPDTGKIYVASNFGVLVGDPQGKTWNNPIDPFVDLVGPSYDRRVVSIAALPVTAKGCAGKQGGGNLVFAGGRAGIRRSPDGGSNWCAPTTSTGCNPDPAAQNEGGCIMDMHAFGRSPLVKDQAYVVTPAELDKDKKLFITLHHTPDGGDTWNPIYTAPNDTCRPNGGCAGGIAFVKAIGVGASPDLYFSNRLSISKRKGAKWATFIEYPATSEAGDTRDIAFDSKNEPVLAATDGGLVTPPGAGSTTWTFAGDKSQGNGPNGFNALQIYEVTGQWIGNSRHDLYFGTQDNQLWSSGDSGKGWGRWGNEGGLIEAAYRVATGSDSQITFRIWENQRSGPLFYNPTPNSWPDPAGKGNAAASPKIVRKNFHVQGVNEASTLVPSPTGGVQPAILWSNGLAVNYDFGKLGLNSWTQYAAFNGERRDLPKLSVTKKGAVPILYQAIRSGMDVATSLETHHLARIAKMKQPSTPVTSVTYPTMKYFGGLGMGPTMNPSRVFALDPGNVDHLIAADAINERMMETGDGGHTWVEMKQLNSLVTNGGQLNFRGRVFFSQFPPWWATGPVSAITQASAISFCPDNSKTVAVGTVQSGIFISSDGGKDQTWTKVPGSERVTLISALHWRKADDLIVSTYGRGLWRVRFNVVIPVAVVPCKIPDCFHVYYQRPPGEQPSPFEQAVLAIGGRIKGARFGHGIAQELFIQPDTSVAFASDSREVPHIRLTETTRQMGFLGLKGVPRAPKGAPIIAGLTLRKTKRGSELVGVLFSRRPMSMYAADEQEVAEEEVVGGEQSPIAGKPYIEILTGPLTSPGRTIELTGRGFAPGSLIEIAIDGYSIEKVLVRDEGKFSATVQAPNQFGLHSLTIIDPASGRVIDGTMVTVRPEDRPRRRGRWGQSW